MRAWSHDRATADAHREFERLYRDSYPLVYNYVRYRVVDADVAEDVVSEAFLLAARSFGKFDPTRAKFSTWVTKIAINCMNDYWRKQHVTASIDDVADAYVSLPSYEDAVGDKALALQLLGALSAEEREIVVLKYREGYRNVEIASMLGMNASTVSTKVAHALKVMRAAAGEA